MSQQLLVLILDGWGHSANIKHNAILQTPTPNWDRLNANHPQILLQASGSAVGLPAKQAGNSEVGHITIGAGRVILQSMQAINNAIADNTLAQKHVIKQLANYPKVHLVGMLSAGGVHSHKQHLYSLIKIITAQNKHTKICLHLIADGRDVRSGSIKSDLLELQNFIAALPQVVIVSLSGRFYAMDRDLRWERTDKFLQVLEGSAEKCYPDIESLIADLDQDDEFITPSLVATKIGVIAKDDAILIFNFRADRVRQLCYALSGHKNSESKYYFNYAKLITLTCYDESIKADVVFKQPVIADTLSLQLANNGLKQLKITESEKQPHLNYFLNGKNQLPLPDEDSIVINSPNVKTYDFSPRMNLDKLTKILCNIIKADCYDVIFCNIANADMLGHTGNFNATCEAIAAIDESLGKIVDVVKQTNSQLLITADHGNAELMFDDKEHRSHSRNPVPLVYFGQKCEVVATKGTLADIAPTILSLCKIPISKVMQGRALISLK